MIRRRTDGQVVASGGQIDEALTRLPAAQVVALVDAREVWRASGSLPPVTADLVAGLGTAAAAEWDAIFVRRARAELRLRP